MSTPARGVCSRNQKRTRMLYREWSTVPGLMCRVSLRQKREACASLSRPQPKLVKYDPSIFQILLLASALRPVADAAGEDGVQPVPLRAGERHRVVAAAHRLELALDDVGRDVGAGDLARERVGRIELVAGCRTLLLPDLGLGNEGRRCIARIAALLQRSEEHTSELQ